MKLNWKLDMIQGKKYRRCKYDQCLYLYGQKHERFTNSIEPSTISFFHSNRVQAILLLFHLPYHTIKLLTLFSEELICPPMPRILVDCTDPTFVQGDISLKVNISPWVLNVNDIFLL